MAYQNFEVNKKYNKFYSSNYLNFSFVEPELREILEFHSIGEFNAIRGKDFISFSSFHSVYVDSQMKLPFGNYAHMLTERLRQF